MMAFLWDLKFVTMFSKFLSSVATMPRDAFGIISLDMI